MSEGKGIDWELGKHAEQEETKFAFLVSSQGNRIQNFVALICLALATFCVIFVLGNSIFGGMENWIRRSVFLSAGLIYVFLSYPLGRARWNEKLNWFFAVDLALMISVIITQIYIMMNYKAIADPTIVNTKVFTLMGSMMVLAVLEATRRCLSPVVVLVPGFFMLHALFAEYFPGRVFGGPSVPWRHLIDATVNVDTLFGFAMEIMVSMLGLFMIFGTILMKTNVASFFISFANALTGHTTGGPAKVSVISSGLMATISGSPTSNVVTTGVVTIPLMKRLGYSPSIAGGIEACASNGGHIMPPVMGLVAFLIAGIIGMEYGELAARAVLPACLYFLSVLIFVDVWARKKKLQTLDRADLPDLAYVLKEGWILFLPLIAITVVLFMHYSAVKAAIIGILFAVVVSFLIKETRLNPLKIIEILEEAMRISAPIIVACGMVGIILGALFTSGIGARFASNISHMAGGHVIIILFLTAIASIILGMGMPVIAVYIVISTLIIPSLVELTSVEPLQAHLFVFYYAVVSGITPPVCITAFAAAGVAMSDPLRTGFQAFLIGLGKYFVPLLFFFRPALLLYGSLYEIVLVAIIGMLGVFALEAGVVNYILVKNRWYETLLLFVSASLLIPDRLIFDLIAILFMIGIIISQLYRKRLTAPKHIKSWESKLE